MLAGFLSSRKLGERTPKWKTEAGGIEVTGFGVRQTWISVQVPILLMCDLIPGL
jgi:hypothetical protein